MSTKWILAVCATAAVMALAAPAQAAIIDGLVANWHLDDNYVDSSVNGYDGTTPGATNNPTFVSGQFANAVSFDEDGDYINVPGSATSMDFNQSTDNFSFSFWAELGVQSNVYYGIIDKKLSRAANRPGYLVSVDGGKLTFSLSDGVNQVTIKSVLTVTDSALRQYIVTVDRSATAKIYINGVLDATSASLAGIGDSTNADDVKIGTLAGASGNWMNGTLDEVGIWNRVLTSDEIAALQTSEIIPEPATLALLGLGGLMMGVRGRRRNV